ncbi:type II toxin-antitoxin system VapC family toxin (plasmid) [Picosynechococcus sp. PCC 11901]|uniref:type II toxin-antitoxin system VapC family toxin n=1 Tax=Picosynechococcus sp. PCC 11901 TaxID=2579791 RepID=UPI0010FBDA87|nr:type II toxin-antitoxin system VapC family toxin [Picosynechococcus sp. PCC 11901]QCS48049.1 type II toxin-antitoxin system VapC family toxin [Picosynechococcus sp. PCC 11901]
MIKILVDSNVLIDVFSDDSAWFAWSHQQLAHFIDRPEIYRLVINPVIYAEVSIGIESTQKLDQLLPPKYYTREPLPYDAAFIAGKAFLQYRRNGGKGRSPLPDFYIGAHALTVGYRLLSRDRQRYQTYFPDLDLIAP